MPGWNPRVCLWGVRKRSRHRANLEHSIPVARPARFLSFWAAHANARGSFRGHDPKVVQMQKPIDTKKATAAASETIDEVFHEAMRSYEKALKSGIQLQEESVNLWKD